VPRWCSSKGVYGSQEGGQRRNVLQTRRAVLLAETAIVTSRVEETKMKQGAYVRPFELRCCARLKDVWSKAEMNTLRTVEPRTESSARETRETRVGRSCQDGEQSPGSACQDLLQSLLPTTGIEIPDCFRPFTVPAVSQLHSVLFFFFF
jgi:hypothetical protein